MLTGSFDAASNRATWSFTLTLEDDETDAPIDLTGATANIAVRSQHSRRPTLTGSSTDGKIEISSPATDGILSVIFSKTDMTNLEGGEHYDVGLAVTLSNGDTHQLIKATLPIIDGVLEP